MTQKDPNVELRNIANASGFLLQLRIEDEIRSTRSDHGWEVIAKEHPWIDGRGQDRYIDLVLQQGLMRMVIECKRPREGSWVFLVPSKPLGAHGGRLSYLWTERMGAYIPLEHRTRIRWAISYHDPESYISDFCAVRGSGEDQKAMLERIAGILVNGAEALAGEELVLSANISYNGRYFYVPVVVTTAQLFVCRFMTDEISLAQGTLPEDKGVFEAVPYIRFRHTLTPKLPKDILVSNISQANQLRERTLLVVHAGELASVLKHWPISEPPLS